MSKEMLVAINVLKREWTLAERESHVGSKVDSFNKLEGINILYTMTLLIVNSFFRTFVYGTLIEMLAVLSTHTSLTPFQTLYLAPKGLGSCDIPIS
jgi:hypothetical protein